MTGGRSWTSEDDDTLRALWSREPSATIADKMGRTRGAIQKRARKIGLKWIRPITTRKPRVRKGPSPEAMEAAKRSVEILQRWPSDIRRLVERDGFEPSRI